MYVHNEVVKSLTDYKQEQCFNLGREVAFSVGVGDIWVTIFDCAGRSLSPTLDKHVVSVESTLHFLCNPVHHVTISNLELSFGMLSRLKYFEKQQSNYSSKLLVEIASVVIDLVAYPEPAMQLESSIISWKCLKLLMYLNQSSKLQK